MKSETILKVMKGKLSIFNQQPRVVLVILPHLKPYYVCVCLINSTVNFYCNTFLLKIRLAI